MHIPDGFISPKAYVPAYVVAAGCWTVAVRRLRRDLPEEAIPRLAVLTALAFVLTMVAIPLPGGTSVHAVGVALLAVLFGVWTSFLAISLVLLVQAALFGAGGMTSLPVNALALGLVASAVAWTTFRVVGRFQREAGLFLAGWLSVNVAALLLALVLGWQPRLDHAVDGTPRFFPFGPEVTIPALLIPHAIVGVGEGILTALVWRLLHRSRRGETT